MSMMTAETEAYGHHSNINNTTGRTHQSASNSNTDQDALFDLILQQVPAPKREMLSTTWSKDYLNRLTSLPARALHNEPEKLREEQVKVERDMSELAFRDYKAFILVKDCKQDVQSTFESLGQHLDHFQETIPEFVDTLSGFSAKVAPILERQHVFSSILATHSQLLEVLEIPLLMETCVRNGYYNEALELASHVQRLVLRYPGIGIIQEIDTKVAQGKEMMLVQLLAQLREPIKLPVALRIIGFLRRIGSFKGQLDLVEDDDHHHHLAITSKPKGSSPFFSSVSGVSSSGTGVEDETPLKMLFLKSRGLYMNLQLSKVVYHKGDSFGYLKKYIDVTRECLFDIMTYYKSIFGSVDHFAGFSSSLDFRGTGSADSSPTATSSAGSTFKSSQNYPKQHSWTTDNLLADFVTYRTQTLLQLLKAHIPQINDTSALSSILTQLMYFGANMAKIGFDLRYLVTSLFEEAVIRVVGGAFQRGTDEFIDGLGGDGKNYPDWLLPSQWMLGGTGRAPSSTSSTPPSSSTVTSPVLGRGEGSPGSTFSPTMAPLSMSPQTCLMDYPALAYLTNSYLAALNSLRLLAPLSLAIPLREILVDSLLHVDMALEKYDRLIFGERPSAFRSSLIVATAIPATSSDTTTTTTNRDGHFKLQGREGSAVLHEKKIMDGFIVVYKRAVQDYIFKCFDEGIYGGLVFVEKDLDAQIEEQPEVDIEPAPATEDTVEETTESTLEPVADNQPSQSTDALTGASSSSNPAVEEATPTSPIPKSS
ncbi:conserved oligomeric Golgi complex component [Linnemannia schmuckeri]|uniref:Conserved oligomeric Golgi complex subunit 8 n=1 Tax=Linnemannia schmuckeri TaxID=64567 RepID=A0A9P5V9U1_9FUNG|nr:conserved oligomeric Golgi complex component [Linnemannia schmuckeri]